MDYRKENDEKTVYSNSIAYCCIAVVWMWETTRFGRSEGDMKDMSILTEAKNLEDAVEMILEQDFADPERIYLAGASQGAL